MRATYSAGMRSGALPSVRRARLMQRRDTMLAELSIIPLGTGTSLSNELAEILKLIDASGLSYQLTPSGTCIEGDWDAVMRVARQCHDHARSVSAHVITALTIEDEQGATDKLTSNVAAIEERLGRKLKRSSAT